jgi:hypothetical protein
MFQQYIAILMQALVQRNIKVTHPIYIYNAQKK